MNDTKLSELATLVTATDLPAEAIAVRTGLPLATVYGFFDGYESFGYLHGDTADAYASRSRQEYARGYLAGAAARERERPGDAAAAKEAAAAAKATTRTTTTAQEAA